MSAPTSASVEAAMAEFDKIGNKAFLQKYEKGHEPNRWLLRVGDNFYPMKAIWVASHNPPANPSVKDYRNGIRDLRNLGYFDIVAIEEKDHRLPLIRPTYQSVLIAMQEYLRIGAESFFVKYAGNSPSKGNRYIRHEDIDYPLKALFAAAHTPPARVNHFGNREAEAEMKSMGFKVIIRRRPTVLKEDNNISAIEGLRFVKELNVIKRSRSIVEKAKSLRVPLVCEVCDFNFEKCYGAHGRDFIEAHHLDPLSKRGGVDAPTSVEDFALLCANCHRMIHHRGDCLTIQELKQLLRPSAKI